MSNKRGRQFRDTIPEEESDSLDDKCYQGEEGVNECYKTPTHKCVFCAESTCDDHCLKIKDLITNKQQSCVLKSKYSEYSRYQAKYNEEDWNNYVWSISSKRYFCDHCSTPFLVKKN